MGPASTPTNFDADDADGISEFVSESEWQSSQAQVGQVPAAVQPGAPRIAVVPAVSANPPAMAPPVSSAPVAALPPLVAPLGPVGLVGRQEPPDPLSTASSTRPELTLTEVSDAAGQLSWPEAVAFIREYLLSSPERGLCDPASMLLCATGEVLQQPGAVTVTHPARAAAELLVKLLPPDTPSALQALAKEEAGPAPRRRTALDLAQALAFFERPNRRGDLAALWTRADVALGERRSARTLARIRREIEHPVVAAPVVNTPRVWWAWRDIWAQNYALGAVLCGIFAVGSSAWLLVSVSGGARNPRPIPARPIPRLVIGLPEPPLRARVAAIPPTPRPSDTESDPVLSIVPVAPAVASAPASDPVPAAVPTTGSTEKPESRDTWVVTMRELVPAPRPVVVAPDQPPPAPPRVAPAVPRATSPARIYTAADADVVPATIQWPQMVLDVVTGDHADSASVLRLTIDEAGRVERVHLLSPGNSFNDRMILAAAKAWVFRPARLSDKPVKYQLDIRLKR